MSREVRELRKELNKENSKIFLKIEQRLGQSNMDKRVYNETIEDLLAIILETQKNEEDLNKVFGYDLDKFCSEVIENSLKEKLSFKIFNSIYKMNFAILSLIIFGYVFSRITGGDFIIKIIGNLKIEINTFKIVVYLLVILGIAFLNKLKIKVAFKSKYIIFLVEVFWVIAILSIDSIYEYAFGKGYKIFNFLDKDIEANILVIILLALLNFIVFKLLTKRKIKY